MRHVTKLLPLLLIGILVAPASARDKRKRNAREIPTVALPVTYDIDLRLALGAHGARMMGSASLPESESTEAARDVFQHLAANYPALPFSWRLTLVNNDVVNAESSAAGQVYAYGGIVRLLGANKGLWAAALSHEVAHTALRHQVRLFLQREYIAQQLAYYRRLAASGDNTANWVIVGLTISAPIALNKISRDQEHQADAEGMVEMARSGYHPDFVFALHHQLRIATGEQSKFAAFFSDHPRWATRDQRSEKIYSDALAEFNSRWPDAGTSPGGSPPAVAFLGEPAARENKARKSLEVSVPVSCLHTGSTVTVAMHLAPQKGGTGTDVRSSAQCNEQMQTAVVTVPGSSVDNRDRKFKAAIGVISEDGKLIEMSKQFDVRVPKP